MDAFQELTEAQQLITGFMNSPARVGGDCRGVLEAIYDKIEAYKRRKRRQQQNPQVLW
jgi:hypothetical protein